MRRGALTLMALAVTFWLFMGIGEMVSGDPSGVIHLVPAILTAGLALPAWKRPLIGGTALIALSVIASIYFYNAVNDPQGRLGAAAIMGGPFLLFGLLFILAAALTRPAPHGVQ